MQRSAACSALAINQLTLQSVADFMHRSLIIIVALDSAAVSLKADAVAGMACSALAINQLTFLSAADFTRQLSSIFWS